MDVRIEDRQPVDVVYVVKTGPYNISAPKAWQDIGCWIQDKGLQGHVDKVIGFGMDSPVTTPAPLIRYIAAFSLSEGLQEDPDNGVYQMTIPGGAYAVHLMIGPYQQMPDRFQKLQTDWLPTSGHQIDFCRPFLELYLSNPKDTPESEYQTDICLPLKKAD